MYFEVLYPKVITIIIISTVVAKAHHFFDCSDKDPATFDVDLRKKLEHSRKEGISNMEQVIIIIIR